VIEALAEQGIEVPFEKVRSLIAWVVINCCRASAHQREDTPRGKEITRRRKEIFKTKYLPTLRPTPGARDLLSTCHARDLRLVAASSAKKDELDPLLRICGGEKLIESQTSSDDADNLEARPGHRAGGPRQDRAGQDEVLMLGDTPYDIESATPGRAGDDRAAVRRVG